MALLRPAILVALAGCGLGGGTGGGGDNLPVSGAGPYGKLADYDLATPLDEPFLIVDPTADLLDPAPLRRADGAIDLYYTRRVPGGAAEIWRAVVRSLRVAPEPGEPYLVDPGGDASSPAPIIEDGALVVYYQGSSPDGPFIGRAGGGAVIAGATQPTAIRVRDVTYLYFTRPSRPGIFVATSVAGGGFDVAPDPVLAPSGAGSDRFDAVAVGEPAAAGGVTAAGETRIALFFTGTDDSGATAIGFAASRDGRQLDREPEPILDPALPSERAPGPLLGPTLDVLFFSQVRAGRAAIAVATAP